MLKISEIYENLDGRELIFLDSELNPVRVRSIKKVPYSGRIYDVDVPNDIILVQRDGIPLWSGNSNHNDGTCYNSGGVCNWTTGKFSYGAKFDGVDDYVDCGNDSSLNITDAITIEAWVKPTDFES